MQAYFDNSATTKPAPEAVDAAYKALSECWGNPSSLHRAGNQAAAVIEDSREAVAKVLGCESKELFFTSGGTEANNLALTGAAEKMKRCGKRIVSTVAEHPSVYDTLTYLETKGFEIVRLGIDSEGKINPDELFEAITPDTILVSVMSVNNEVGSIMPVEKIKKAVARAKSNALIHCDAVQAFGKIPLRPGALGIDLMSISSHKIHGPKGAGALYVSKKVKISPLFHGGEQEMKVRPGTEAVPAIAGFGAAAKLLTDINAETEKVRVIRDRIVSSLKEAGGVVFNSPGDALPYILNISVPGIKSEPLMNYLSANGICVSSGSACSKGKRSRVLTEMNLPFERLESPVRISLSRFNTAEEADYLTDMIKKAQSEIRKTV